MPESEAEAMRRLLDTLPIYATRIGYRTDSTPEERTLGEAVFKVHSCWLELRDPQPATETAGRDEWAELTREAVTDTLDASLPNSITTEERDRAVDAVLDLVTRGGLGEQNG